MYNAFSKNFNQNSMSHSYLRACSKFLLKFCLLGFCSLSMAAQAQLIPVSQFFQNPRFSDAKLSPDGKSLAMLMSGHDDRVVLAVLEIGQLQPKVIANYGIRDIRNFHWVNNERLVYDLSNRKLAQGETFYGPGLYAVNKDGTKRLSFVNHSTAYSQRHLTERLLPWNTFFLDVAHNGDTADIFVIQGVDPDGGSNSAYDLYRLNTLTGNTELIERPGKVSKWLIDKQGVPRIARTIAGAIATIHYKDPKTGQWRKLAEFDWTKKHDIDPLFFSPEGDLYVRAYHGQDTSSLYRFDLQKNQLEDDPVISLKGYDFNGDFAYATLQKKVLGIHYEMGTAASLWFDEDMALRQKKLDELLPNTVNRISVGEENRASTLLVHSYSDTEPGLWQLYDFVSGKLTRLGNSQPGIDPAQMSFKELVHFKARDGLEIPAYLTLPKQGTEKNLPMVVLVHGGPYVRGGHWDWKPEVQFLASRGYAVLEPEFRGSTGYGMKHFQAGIKQWGLAMQDDIADGTRWAITQGYADPKRICIAGASYGGYATLMGLIKDPDLYRCGIDWVGVTDINLLYDIHWSDVSEEWKTYGMPALVGDPLKDAAQLKATSPIENVARIKQPLLLAYGGADRRVPLPHGSNFYDAVKAGNPRVEWVEYPEEGHGFYLLKNKVDFWSRVETFLEQNIKQK
ncbi:MAG: S9 family peptidase [Burkholderiales bacterium]|nr:S9 family peptidase [Burkholderiales bacterium]